MGEQFELPLSSEQIQQLIPHRYPFLLVDTVIEFEDGERIVGTKCVTANEPFFQGHFPGRPIMPGVLMLEALAQLGAIFAKLSTGGSDPDGLIVFSAADEVRFRRQVVPGDVLRLEMIKQVKRRRFWKMLGIASVDGEKATEGILMAAEV